MAKRLFGTDGIRGVANQKLTPELAFQIGCSAGELIGPGATVVVGCDTRRSGSMLGAALAAGFCSVGVDVATLGVAPTGAISYIARTGGYGLGIVISASHNPAPDNGIKLIGADGCKVTDEFEVQVEERLESVRDSRLIGGEVGCIHSRPEEIERYLTYLETLVPERLEGMKLVVDCSHGAAFETGPEILSRLGAQLIVMGAQPDGMNINAEGGATKPQTIQEAMRSNAATLGIAFDGDADRAVFSDSQGRLINGDRTMAIWSDHWNRNGQFDPKVVVGTVMSNGGFEAYLADHGVQLSRANVGDKYVAARMRELGAKVGGEQSGHIIFAERGPTGDGLITALELLRVLKREGRSASEFYGDFSNWPQKLTNVELQKMDGWSDDQRIRQAMKEGTALLGEKGRINVRASGTQPMVRVMVESSNEAMRDQVSASVVGAMLSACGGRIYSEVDLTHALGD